LEKKNAKPEKNEKKKRKIKKNEKKKPTEKAKIISYLGI